jgi:ferredoxin-NADP reductase/ferredoxin
MTNITFRCDSEVHVQADWDETVIDALLRSGTRVPFFCKSGICGQCKSLLAAGEVVEIGSAPQILSEEEVRLGHILICRSIAVTDCEIIPQNLPTVGSELPWPDACEVVAAGWIAPGLFHFRVRLPADSKAPSFLFYPGQYSYLQSPQKENGTLPSRLYPATRPGQRYLDFYLTAEAEERARSLHEAFRVGASVQLARPVGASSLKESESGPLVIAAANEGLPSVLSMLELLNLKRGTRPVRVVLRGTREGHLERQILQLCAEGEIGLDFSRDAPDVRAALEAALAAVTGSAAKASLRPNAYVKGDEGLVRLAREVLYARGLRPWEVHAEILGGARPDA